MAEQRRVIKSADAPNPVGYYSQAIASGDLLFCSGQIAIDPGTGQVETGSVAAQTERVMSNLAAVLGSAGATWKDVVKTTVFLHDMSDFPVVNEVYGRVLGDARPARSTVQVSALPRGVLVEIDAVVAIP